MGVQFDFEHGLDLPKILAGSAGWTAPIYRRFEGLSPVWLMRFEENQKKVLGWTGAGYAIARAAR
jgi:hypothetical protein